MKQDEDQNILDTPKKDKVQQSVVKEMIIWWEKRRLIYNILIVGTSVFLIHSFWSYPMRAIIGNVQIIMDAIIFILGMNLCYTLGWGLCVTSHYVFKTSGLTNTGRWILFTIGTFFSLALTDIYFVLKFDVLFA